MRQVEDSGVLQDAHKISFETAIKPQKPVTSIPTLKTGFPELHLQRCYCCQ